MSARPLQSNQNTVEQSRTESNTVESGRTKSNKVELQQFFSVRLCDCVRPCSTVFDCVRPCSMAIIFTILNMVEHSRTWSNTVEHSRTSRTQSQSRTATIFFGSTLFDFVRPDSTVFDSVRLRLCSGSTAGVLIMDQSLSGYYKKALNQGMVPFFIFNDS